MAQGKLSNEARTFVVQALACFDTPSTVAEAVKKEFGAVVTRQHIESFDPTKKAGQNLAPKWKALFESARSQFLDDTTSIGVSHRAVRLRSLNRMIAKAEDMGNLSLAAQLLEQAAKETGNAFTNRRELTGKDGKDLPAAAPATVTLFQLPDNGRG